MKSLCYVVIALLAVSQWTPATVAQTGPLQLDDEHFETLDVARPPWDITVVDSEGDVGEYASLAIPTVGPYAGWPGIAYYDYTHGNLKYAQWDGTHWQPETVHDSAADVGRAASLAFSPVEWYEDGLLCISYQDRSSWELKVVHFDGFDWYWFPDEIWDLHRTYPGEATSVKFLPSGDSVVAFHGLTNLPSNLPQYVLLYRGANGEVTLVEGGKYAGYRCSMAIDPDHGRPAIAYTGPDSTLKYASLEEDGNWGIENAVNEEGVGWYCSLVFLPNDPLDPDDNQPAIAFYDMNAEVLRFAWREGSNTWHTAVVDPDPDVGMYPSLAILRNGQPAMSYAKGGPNSNSRGELRYAWHREGDFDAGWHIEVVERPGVGWHSSLAILPTGSPCVSYYDQTNGQLKYARRRASADVEVDDP